MTPEQIDRVFGRDRLRMVTSEFVEVFREAARPGDRRRYTKRFLNTLDADFGQWTEREWRILARLIGHGIDCVPDVVQFDRGQPGGTQLVQTYDAGATVDQWATLLPVSRESRVLRHVFEDCAHWWALAHHCLRALFAIHELSVVHLDIKGDNVCIPVGPPGFDPDRAGLRLYPRFAELALIDFAFALVSRESLTTALPIGWQTDYDYQSPRLLSALEAGRRGNLKPTRELDWRCDMYSLAAMLKRYLPLEDAVLESGLVCGWSLSRVDAARELVLALRDAHDRDTPLRRPHEELMQLTATRLAEADLSASLAAGWTLARDANVTPIAISPLTPLTRLAPPIRVIVAPRERETITAPPAVIRRRTQPVQSAPNPQAVPQRKSHAARMTVLATLVATGIGALAAPLIDSQWPVAGDTLRSAIERVRATTQTKEPAPSTAQADGSGPTSEPSMPKAVPDAPPHQVPAVTPTEARRPATEQADEGAPAPKASIPPKVASDATPSPVPAAAATEARRPSSTRADEIMPARAASMPPKVASNARPRQVLAATPPEAPAAASAAASAPVPAASPQPAPTPSAGATTPSRSATTRTARVPAEVTRKAAPVAAKRATPPAVDAKQSAVRLASAAGAPAEARVRIYVPVPDPVPVASPQTPAPIATTPIAPEPVPVAPSPVAPVPESSRAEAPVVGAPIPPPSQSRIAQAPSPPPSTASPPSGIKQDLRNLLGSIFGFAKRSDRAPAPIEERAPQSPAGSPPPPTGERDRLRENASPSEPPRVALLPTLPANPTIPAPPGTASRMFAPPAMPPAEVIPQIRRTDGATAARAEPDVARVLWLAAGASHPAQERAIVDALRQEWWSNTATSTSPGGASGVARQLNENARQAYLVHRDVQGALDLQLRAFGSDSSNPEIAGNLAFLYLKQTPPQAETARQMAMHAIGATPALLRATRADDWHTLAVASALTGRGFDATNALYVAIAITRSLDRSCKLALAAVDRYGDPLVAPVQAMMLRIRQRGREYESPNCTLPSRWQSAGRNF